MNVAFDMPVWLAVGVAVLATARLTRLVTADYITAPLRARIDRRWGDESWQSYLTTCDWCMSIYTAAIVVTTMALWLDNRAVMAVMLALSASYVTGLLSQIERIVTPAEPAEPVDK